ncbi:hypothetical protein [Engelhardtia mirabilis]|uniref:IPT/TIG domain protein n=1 Tax=Engelhardtia mirabilis TaxID=2528011 RepID=A0A518BN83_9BACT|nr:hypothetical protein Pla133_35130 [Planctomycetes bacterium Pla133]QDV02741.1 hypothetical protein Pla86_35110 [Planctomycetes bacterium Pla86]
MRPLLAGSLSLTVLALATDPAGAQTEGIAAYGSTCGSEPVLALTGIPIEGGSLSYVPLGSAPGNLLVLGVGFSDASFLGLPLPLGLAPFGFPGGCELYTSADLVLFTQGFGQLELPANTSGLHLYLQLIEFAPLSSAFVGASEAYDVTILTPGSTVDLFGPATGTDGTLVTIAGSGFAVPFQNNCVAMTSEGLGIVESGTDTSLTVRVEGSDPALGKIGVVTGLREQVDTSAFVYPAGSTPVPGISVFSGALTAATVGISAAPFDLQDDPLFTPFQALATTDAEGAVPGLTYQFDFPNCDVGDKLKVWMRIEENGMNHDVYFTDGISYASKQLKILVAMHPAKCALWARAWLIQSLQPRIVGIQVVANGGSIQISVNNGTGIVGLKGGFKIVVGP